MLQWMGGSRRKVTTSRKSTQKRQKQYFEQRKREQQQQMAGSEGYADEPRKDGKHQKECRSLDILSLLNLSTVPEEGRSCPSRRDGKNSASTMKYHIPKDPPTIIKNSVPPPYSAEIKEAGAPPSSCQSELQYPKISFCHHDNHASNGISNTPNLLNAANEKQFSVFDMLSDDASGDTAQKSLVHEAHVAFSIEGLGKIRTETPPHSPKQPGRISYDCAFPWNIASQLNSSKNANYVLDDLELEMNAMMQDIDMPLVGEASEFSLGKTDLHGNWKTKPSTVTDHMQVDSHYSSRECSFGDTNIFYNIRRREDMSDARPSFLDDDFLPERTEDVSWKYTPHKIDAGDFLEYDKGEMSHCGFEGHHMLKKRDVKATKLNSLEPPSPKHTTSEIGHDFTTLTGLSRAPVRRNFDIRGLQGQPDWPYFETEDAKDNLSLPSEESCSSSAVRGETIDSSPPNLMSRHSRRISNTCGRSRRKYDVDSVFTMETNCKDRDNLGQRSRNRMTTPVLSKSKATKPISSCFRGIIESSQTRLFEEGCKSDGIDFGFSSFHCTSEAKLPSLGCKLRTEDPIRTFPVPELNFDVNSCFDGPEHGEPIHYPPSGCFTSEKFCEPFNHTSSYDSPVFSKVMSGSVKRDSSPASRVQVVSPDSSHTASPHRETVFPDLSIQGSISGDCQIKSNLWPANCEQFELEKEHCPGNDSLFPDVPMAVDSSNSKSMDIECKEAKDGTPKAKENLKTCSPEHGEEISSSVKIHDKSESSTTETGCNCDAEIPLPCQSGTEDLKAGKGNAKLEVGKAINRKQSNGEDTSKQVMVQAYVLQLLCVEKVRKEASALDIMKKV